MLDDRPYMRSETGRAGCSMTMLILVANVVCFSVQYFFGGYSILLSKYFALSAEGLRHGFVWQLFTFQFMHGGLLHLLFNSIAIYCFGRAVEETVGPRTFLKLYIFSGIIGGLIQILV